MSELACDRRHRPGFWTNPPLGGDLTLVPAPHYRRVPHHPSEHHHSPLLVAHNHHGTCRGAPIQFGGQERESVQVSSWYHLIRSRIDRQRAAWKHAANSYRNDYQNPHNLQMRYCNPSSLEMLRSTLSTVLPTSSKARAVGTPPIARSALPFDALPRLLLATQA